MLLSGIFEWVLGNSFSATVFCSFGCFWFALGGTLNPNFGAYAFYATDPEKPATGMEDPTFNASLGKHNLRCSQSLQNSPFADSENRRVLAIKRRYPSGYLLNLCSKNKCGFRYYFSQLNSSSWHAHGRFLVPSRGFDRQCIQNSQNVCGKFTKPVLLFASKYSSTARPREHFFSSHVWLAGICS
jgi:hypothetical protein